MGNFEDGDFGDKPEVFGFRRVLGRRVVFGREARAFDVELCSFSSFQS